ncbi:MAG: nuclear transport factor 2 family protein [Pseudomonadota bacterium]
MAEMGKTATGTETTPKKRVGLTKGGRDRTDIEELVYRSCLLMDDKDFSGFLDLCDDTFKYSIVAYSPEIRREMNFQEQDRKGMEKIFALLPKHNSDHGALSRCASVYTVDWAADADEALVTSRIQVFRTELNGGVTQLFCVGRLYDTVAFDSGQPKLRKRVVRLDTRMLGLGSHIPI